MVFAPPQHAAAALNVVVDTLTQHGLQVKRANAQAWPLDPSAQLPPQLAPLKVQHL